MIAPAVVWVVARRRADVEVRRLLGIVPVVSAPSQDRITASKAARPDADAHSAVDGMAPGIVTPPFP